MLSLDIDLAPLWESINQFFPVFLQVLSVPAGISLAIAIVLMIVNEFKRAI